MIAIVHPADCDICHGTLFYMTEVKRTETGTEWEIRYPCPNAKPMFDGDELYPVARKK